MKQAVSQLYFKLLFLFPTHCSQQPLPRAGWPLINMEYPSPACSARDAPAIRMFVPIAGQGKRNFWNDLDKKKKTVSFGSLTWTVLELLCGGSIYTRKIQANRLPWANRMASVSNIFFLRIKSLDLCHVIILQSCEWKALQLWSVCFLSSPTPAFPGMVSTASYQINTSKFVLSWFNFLQKTAPPGMFLVLASLLCSFNPCPLYK